MTAEHKAFYEELLGLSWLAPEVRRAIFKVLGRDYGTYKAEFNYGSVVALRHLIAEEKASLKKAGERPRGGLSNAAKAKIADRVGMTEAYGYVQFRLARKSKRTKKPSCSMPNSCALAHDWKLNRPSLNRARQESAAAGS